MWTVLVRSPFAGEEKYQDDGIGFAGPFHPEVAGTKTEKSGCWRKPAFF